MVIVLIFYSFSDIGSAKTYVANEKINYLKAFTKVYGYVKYFHPSDEGSEIDWDYFAIYGAEQIALCTTQEQLVETLEKLFNPIAPTIIFSKKDSFSKRDIDNFKPKNLNGYQLTFWQHQGVYLVKDYTRFYNSSKVLKNLDLSVDVAKPADSSLFEYQLKANEYIQKEIGDNLYCRIPLTLYSHSENGTFPQSNQLELEKLKNNIDLTKTKSIDENFRIGNVINTYNVFQHFYPYRKDIDVNWDKELAKAITKSFLDKTYQDHLITLQMFTAPLKDGHINFTGDFKQTTTYGQGWGDYILPISWSWIEEKLIITKVFDDQLDFKIGDIVELINDEKPEKYFDNIYNRISAGNIGWLNYKAEPFSLLGEKDSYIEILVNGEKIKLFRKETIKEGSRLSDPYQPDFKIVNDSVIYLNLTRISEETIEGDYVASRLKKSKYVICDVRGRASYFIQLLPKILTENDTTTSWLNTPRTVYPDQEKLIGYKGYSWELKKEESNMRDKLFIFLIDGSAISYAESGIGYVQGYNLGTTIGQPTAGANGNINILKLPGGFNTRWTGMKTLKLNGERHHGIGFLPDVYVNKTIEGLINGKDEILEKAIELIKKNGL